MCSPFGGIGGSYGGYRQAAAAAQSRAAHAAYQAHAGAFADAHRAKAETYRRSIAALDDAGIRAGEIIAWRVWRVVGDRLQSMAVHHFWPPDEPMQGNTRGLYEGVHAFKTKKQCLNEYAMCFMDWPVVTPFGARLSPIGQYVIGQVALWGEVIEFENGYRAEFGKVHYLDEVHGTKKRLFRKDRTLENLRRVYGVEDAKRQQDSTP